MKVNKWPTLFFTVSLDLVSVALFLVHKYVVCGIRILFYLDQKKIYLNLSSKLGAHERVYAEFILFNKN